MKYVRWALGALVGLYVLRNLYYWVLTAGSKSGLMPLSGDNVGFQSLIDAIALWQVVVWAVAIAAYAVAALRLLRGGKALVPLAAGFVLDGGLYLMMRQIPAYQAAPAQVQQIDMLCLAAVAVAVVITWWTERSSAPSAAAA
ncbi:MAG TPA: hypothetical protein VF138_04050 [Caulobacteraceae bacterium]